MNHHGALRLAPCDRLAQRRDGEVRGHPLTRRAPDDPVREDVFDAAGAENPCRDIRLPAVDKPNVVPLSTEIVSTLIDTVTDRWSAVIMLGAGSGVRVSVS
jgi:hypothetical protein